ncbi:hypothetical protein B0H19DRAFT_1073981 [Mycena capillaripes]|nr:hypothetical protein B0H19DRAFT_1073981 [Mycena capillaripes]
MEVTAPRIPVEEERENISMEEPNSGLAVGMNWSRPSRAPKIPEQEPPTPIRTMDLLREMPNARLVHNYGLPRVFGDEPILRPVVNISLFTQGILGTSDTELGKFRELRQKYSFDGGTLRRWKHPSILLRAAALLEHGFTSLGTSSPRQTLAEFFLVVMQIPVSGYM